MTGWERVQSMRFAISLFLSERTGRMRRPARLVPAGALRFATAQGTRRLAELQGRYGVAFEHLLGTEEALQSYEYLDFLDQAKDHAPGPHGGSRRLHAVGPASFGYAGALAAFFRPESMVGVELEGYRRLRGGYNRAELAAAHIASVPGASYVIADYANYRHPAEIIVAFFPFVSPAPVLGWRLPLAVLQPAALFASMGANLTADGQLWLINHSTAEAEVAARHAAAAGLSSALMMRCTASFRRRAQAPVLSVWTHGEAG